MCIFAAESEALIGSSAHFEFQIRTRTTRVERGTDQLSNVSPRLYAVICFPTPPPFRYQPPIYDI